tara:strand:+ start:652 stop:1527 length:876 start_codon:yes stop_codon:yes gene_type:complete
MPNGVRNRGNSRVANRRRNQQRDMAVPAQLVTDAPPIVVAAEVVSSEADPDIIPQLQNRIRQLEERVKEVKRNFKSAKKQADDHDNIISHMTDYFRNMSQEIGMTRGDILSPSWLNIFTKKVIDLQGERDIAEEKYQKAISGNLLSFQEVEIEDLKEEIDKLMKLNKSLLNIKKKDKEEAETMLTINANMTEDFCKMINRIGSKKVSIEGIHISTARLLEKYMGDNPSEDMACCIGANRGLVIQGKHLIDTDKNLIYGYNPKTKDIYDDDDGEVLGKLITKKGKLKIKFIE